MNKLFGLPKSAILKITVFPVLEIKNHEILPGPSLLYLLHWIINEHDWTNMLGQLTSQGFRFEAVIEQCASELESKPLTKQLITSVFHEIDFKLDCHANFMRTANGKQLLREYIIMIRKCSDWDEFYINMKPQSTFNKLMKRRIRKEMSGLPLKEVILGKIDSLGRWFGIYN